jgi:hypothetical protein
MWSRQQMSAIRSTKYRVPTYWFWLVGAGFCLACFGIDWRGPNGSGVAFGLSVGVIVDLFRSRVFRDIIDAQSTELGALRSQRGQVEPSIRHFGFLSHMIFVVTGVVVILSSAAGLRSLRAP